MISSKNFVIVALKLRSWACAYGMRQNPTSLFACCSPADLALSGEEPVLFLPSGLGILDEVHLTTDIGVYYFWTLNSVPLFYMFILMPVPHCLEYCSSAEVQSWLGFKPIQLFSYFSRLLWLLRVPYNSYEFGISYSISAPTGQWESDRKCIEFVDHLGSITILPIVSLSINKHRMPSIYLGLLYFTSAMFYGFQCSSFPLCWSNLFLQILFFWMLLCMKLFAQLPCGIIHC